mgnify:CR=1 FL=1
MYAVIRSGGKQYRVSKDQVIRLEKLEVSEGETVDFQEILMVGEGENVRIGAPFLEDSKVSAEVLAHGRGKKVNIIKFKRRKHHMKRQGHRQWFTEVKIKEIA